MTSTATAVDTVKSLYEAFGRGDIAYIISRVAPDCRWVAPGVGIPDAGVYTGPEGAAEFVRKMHESEEISRFKPRQFFSELDDVVVLGLEECRSRRTGRTASTNWVMHFRVRDGRVTYFETYYDTAAYLRAHQD
jgi:ketosteroid isomerase-like protein